MNKRISFSSFAHQQGLTLVEIMVAITLSLILLAGVVEIFTGNKQTYRVQEATARLQENGRLAIQFMAKDIRIADFWGCTSNVTDVTNRLKPGSYIDPLNGGISGTDNDGLNGSDTIILQGAYGTGIPVEKHTLTSASFKTMIGHGLQVDEIVLASDCLTADIFQVTSANEANKTVVANTGMSVPGNASKLEKEYQGDASIYRLKTVGYALQNGANGQPGLFRSENGNNQELIEGVENMQILYGEDTDVDGSANIYVDASGVTDWENVVSARITLTVRTLEDNLSEQTANGDRRIRRAFTTTVTIRNRVV